MTAILTLATAALAALSTGDPDAVLRPAMEPFEAVRLRAAEVDCDRFAAPYGADRRRRGSARRPFRSVPRLLRSLRTGETGCLLPGRYRHEDPAKLRYPRTGLVGLDGRATVDGAIWITERATGAKVRGIDLTASDDDYFIPLKVQANGARATDNRITGSRSTTCVLIGSTRRAVAVHVERNWIHRCGRRGKLDHLIYVSDARGTVIRGNALTDNVGGWGVHLYPNADGSLIERNLIDGNQGGVIFAGSGGRTSDGNVVRDNTITFSNPRWNIEGSWSGGAIGMANVAYGNCLYTHGPGSPAGLGPPTGFTIGPNVSTGRSPYAGPRSGGGYSFESSASGCASLVEPLTPIFGQR